MSRLVVVSAQSIEARCQVENEDVVGAAPTGGVPTTSELSTILSPTTVCLISEVLRYVITFFIIRTNDVIWRHYCVKPMPQRRLT